MERRVLMTVKNDGLPILSEEDRRKLYENSIRKREQQAKNREEAEQKKVTKGASHGAPNLFITII
ncbi:MAG: hypothetical protein UT65_C0002G0004 [Parcubacteria group bacterium GW2011_GWF2_39_8b]|uniref:Uncharacterized protein n=1 Tax=Candidatus Zambryskibacteria bacterium RIFCSPHIGHO2_02_38_10.5 TaxID=1802742 RepID=A0A1G2T607_9BACT|nr:MAG: hypothetical protein UT65_C0002G0004 [Parcubacteria group bacterium GW2011_GWF2_39_8b]OHA92727.1 MAG: hypothetical protein A2W58_00445 [Candidatus Zambryskibacteria bacterium RIFCSPHIGHO2_02_38_10.5]